MSPSESRASGPGAGKPASSGGARFEWLALLAVSVGFVFFYLRTLDFAFVWDDHAMLGDNVLLEAPLWEGLGASNHAHMGVRYGEDYRPQYDSYRPLMFLSNYLDRALFGRDQGAPHATSILLGLAVLWAAYWLLREWGAGPRLRVGGAALLLVHPVSAEVIGYLSGRGDLLSALFMLLACAALLRGLGREEEPAATKGKAQGSYGWLVTSVLFYLLSLSAKEAYLFVPLALSVKAFQRGVLRRYSRTLAACGSTALAWWTLRSRIAPTASGQAARAIDGLGPELLQYARILVAPFDGSVVRPAAAGSVLVTLLVVSAFGLLSVLALRARRGPIVDVCAAALWFATCMGPSAIAARVTLVASDRYAFLAILSLPFLAHGARSWWASALPLPRASAIAVLGVWGTALLTVAHFQLDTFRDDRALYMNAVNLEPGSASAWFGLGHVIVNAEGCEKAEPLFRRALSLDPKHVRALNNAGVCALRRGALTEAEQAFRGVLELVQGVHPRAWSNLAQIHLQQGKREQACAELERSLRIDPHAAGPRELKARFCR